VRQQLLLISDGDLLNRLVTDDEQCRMYEPSKQWVMKVRVIKLMYPLAYCNVGDQDVARSRAEVMCQSMWQM
jgi:hypothetical protein